MRSRSRSLPGTNNYILLTNLPGRGEESPENLEWGSSANCPPDLVIITLRIRKNTPFQAKFSFFSGDGTPGHSSPHVAPHPQPSLGDPPLSPPQNSNKIYVCACMYSCTPSVDHTAEQLPLIAGWTDSEQRAVSLVSAGPRDNVKTSNRSWKSCQRGNYPMGKIVNTV